MLPSSLGGPKITFRCQSDCSHICLPGECLEHFSLDYECGNSDGVPSDVHSLLKETPGSGRLAASTVNHRASTFLMCFKHSFDYQEMPFTNGSGAAQSPIETAPLQQLGGTTLPLSPATHIPEDPCTSPIPEFPQEVKLGLNF